MKKAIRAIPWFEVILVIGLAVALIVKPQNQVLSASPDAGRSDVAQTMLPQGF